MQVIQPSSVHPPLACSRFVPSSPTLGQKEIRGALGYIDPGHPMDLHLDRLRKRLRPAWRHGIPLLWPLSELRMLEDIWPAGRPFTAGSTHRTPCAQLPAILVLDRIYGLLCGLGYLCHSRCLSSVRPDRSPEAL